MHILHLWHHNLDARNGGEIELTGQFIACNSSTQGKKNKCFKVSSASCYQHRSALKAMTLEPTPLVEREAIDCSTDCAPNRNIFSKGADKNLYTNTELWQRMCAGVNGEKYLHMCNLKCIKNKMLE